eukprot:Em0639g1a
MATSSPEDTYSRFRLHLQGSFSSQEEKETFLRRFEAAKQLLAPGCKRNATISVLNTLLDRVLTQPENVQASNSRTSFSRNEMMLDSAGIYTGDEDASDQDLFVVERKTFKSLCSGLVQQCGCLSNPSWTIASFIKVACTKIVLPQVIARGLNITEVAHDYQATIKLYVRQLGMVNSYDTWHGTKNVAKQLRHICAGTVRTRDRTWFTELSDKARCTKVHLYWCMRNCGGNPVRLRAMIMNISKHFRVITKVALLRVPVNSQCRDTYWVESFNHQLLTYLPKRIHFHTKTFEMRMNLAVMDWNENCQRMATSHHEYTDVRRPDHHSTYNVLVKKTYRFVNNIWSMYVLRNITSQQILQDDEDDDEMVLPDDAAMYDGDYVDSEDDDYVCSEDAIYLVGTALYKFLNWLAYLGALYNRSWWLALDRSATKAGRHPVVHSTTTLHK